MITKVVLGGGHVVNGFTKCFALSAVLGVVLCMVQPGIAQEPKWSPAQQEVLNWIEDYKSVQLTHKIDDLMALYHPRFQNWNYSNEPLPRVKPLVREDYLYLWELFRQTVMELQPVTIEVHGNAAVVNLWYRERWTTPEGKDVTVTGPWTMTLIKKNGKWQHFNWTWMAKEGFFVQD